MYQLFCNDKFIASTKDKQAIEKHIVSAIDSYAEQGYTILNENDNRVELINTNGDQINLTIGFVSDDIEINDNSTDHYVNDSNSDNNDNDNDDNERYIRKDIIHMEQDKTTKINKQDEITSVNNETILASNEVEITIKDSPDTNSPNTEQSQTEINNSAATSNENISQQNVNQSNINNDSTESNQESQNSNTKENINSAEKFDNRVATKIIEILSSQEYNYGNILSAFCANQISSMLVSNQLKLYFIQLNNAILNGKTSIMIEFAINESNAIDIKYILAFCHMLMYLKYQLTFKSNNQVLIVQINW